MSRQYPYNAWVVKSSGAVKLVTLVARVALTNWDRTADGAGYHTGNLHASRLIAARAAIAVTEAVRAKLLKELAELDARLTALRDVEMREL